MPSQRARTASSGATAEFFDELGSRGHEPLLAKARGSARFDVADGDRTEHWLLTIDKGDIDVSRKNAAADCVVRADRAFFDRAVAGERNFLSAVLRGEVTVEGDPKLLVLLQRLFPRPTTRRSRRRPPATARRKR
jgi:putative sterol carrier protein